jgi:putative transcriptional regulator
MARREGPTNGISFSHEVRQLRAKLGLTQEEFAERYQIPLSNLRNWEQESKGVVPDTAARLLIGMIAVEPDRVAGLVQKARARVTEPA